jgi:hypothetical protein
MKINHYLDFRSLGNMSNWVIESIVNDFFKTARSRARVAGLQET